MSLAGRFASLLLGVALGGFLRLAGAGWYAAFVVLAAMVGLPLVLDVLERWSPPDEGRR